MSGWLSKMKGRYIFLVFLLSMCLFSDEFDNFKNEMKSDYNKEQMEYSKYKKSLLEDYKTYKKLFERMRPFFWIMARSNLVPMSFYLKYTKKHEIKPIGYDPWLKTSH